MTLEKIAKSSVPNSRRDFITRLGVDILFMYMAFDNRPFRWLAKQSAKFKTMQQRVAQPPIWPYALDILRTAARLQEDFYKLEDKLPHLYSTACIGAVVGNELGYIQKAKGKIRLGSLGGMLLNRIVDNYSTRKVIRIMSDPRFKAYGFDKFIYERNPNLSIHPSVSELFKPKLLLFEGAGIVVSYFWPLLGYGFGFGAPAIYIHNMGIADALEIGYVVGDKIKEKLQQSATDQQIKDYLKNVTSADLKR